MASLTLHFIFYLVIFERGGDGCDSKDSNNTNKRAMMGLKSLTCIKAPRVGPILTHGLLFEQTW
jgi:hypothetical protein